MTNKIISTYHNGTKVIGEILELEAFYIKIRITSPYCNYENSLAIMRWARQNPNNFLKTYEEVSKRLLIESYKKLNIIDESLDRFCGVYDYLTKELKEVELITDSKAKERIIGKLNDWFFGDFLFTSYKTDLRTLTSDNAKIIEIFEAYKKENRKIYLNSPHKSPVAILKRIKFLKYYLYQKKWLFFVKRFYLSIIPNKRMGY